MLGFCDLYFAVFMLGVHGSCLQYERVINVNQRRRQLSQRSCGLEQQAVSITARAPIACAAAALFDCKTQLFEGGGSPLVEQAVGCGEGGGWGVGGWGLGVGV